MLAFLQAVASAILGIIEITRNATLVTETVKVAIVCVFLVLDAVLYVQSVLAQPFYTLKFVWLLVLLCSIQLQELVSIQERFY